jgi:hypothetical protein
MVIVDKIPKIFSDLITSEHSLATQQQMNAINAFMQKLFPGIQLSVFDNDVDFHNFLDKYHLNPYAEALLVGNTIYVNRALRNADTLLEEYLHPFVEILYNDKPEFFKAMLEEAKKSFTLLNYQIHESYDKGAEIEEKELVTQALSRYFRENLGESKNKHNNFKSFVNRFIKFIKDIFGLESTPEFNKTKNGTRIIPIDSLTNLTNLSDLATALNTEGISFDIKKGLNKQVTYHL